MARPSLLTCSLLVATLALASVVTRAGEGAAVRDAGRYAVHYNAMPSDELDAGLAERYGLPHSGDRCVVTVAVMDKESGSAVRARVMGSATRPDGRMHHVEMREIRDEGGVYYVGELPIESSAELEFKLEIRPSPASAPQTIRFTRRFEPPGG